MYGRKGKGKKSSNKATTVLETDSKQGEDENSNQGNISSSSSQMSTNTDLQEMFRCIHEQQKQQDLMYQDLKLIFQELIQQKIERQDFMQKQEAVLSELYRNLEDKLELSLVQMREELKELKSSVIKKIESSRSYVRDAKDLKESMLNKLDEEKNYLKGKIRDVQKDLMSKIIDVAQIGDDVGKETLGKQKSHKSRLSWFSRRGDHRRAAEFEQSDEVNSIEKKGLSPDTLDESNIESMDRKITSSIEELDSHNTDGLNLRGISEESNHVISPYSELGSSENESTIAESTQSNKLLEDKTDEVKGQSFISNEDADELPDTRSTDGRHEPHLDESPSLLQFLARSQDSLRQLLHESHQQMQQDVLDSVDDKLERAVKSVEVIVAAAKHEMFEIVEKEAQLVRDRMSPKFKARTSYVCDFFVRYFRDMIKNADSQSGPPWHVEQLSSSIRGYVETVGNGDMYVALMYARHPTAVGMQPRSGVKLKVKATVKDIMSNLPDVVIGEIVWSCDETGVKDNRIWGKKIGVVSARQLLSTGYGEREGYAHCAMLIRYDITVC
ncbi:hypothetical protein Btru_008407 [Bulinus truncatus]|nr:hypothetical protein Btru_008407 [Bulinus truncatus]